MDVVDEEDILDDPKLIDVFDEEDILDPASPEPDEESELKPDLKPDSELPPQTPPQTPRKEQRDPEEAYTYNYRLDLLGDNITLAAEAVAWVQCRRAVADACASHNLKQITSETIVYDGAIEATTAAPCVARFLHGLAAVDNVDEDGWTAAHRAAWSGQLESLRCLVLELGADPIAGCAAHGESAIHVATRNGQIDALRCLVTELGVDVETADKWGRTAVHLSLIHI